VLTLIYSAYGNSARKDSVDFVLHLGDYIYESTAGVLGRDPRATSPNRTLLTLYDYRMHLTSPTRILFQLTSFTAQALASLSTVPTLTFSSPINNLPGSQSGTTMSKQTMDIEMVSAP
jgi:hypothetical protein